MAAYRKKAAADRDNLFGGLADAGGSKKKPSGSKNRDELFGNNAPAGSGSNKTMSSSSADSRSSAPSENDPMARLRAIKQNKNRRPVLQGAIREEKLKEAKEHKDKGNKCMQSSFFSKPDPVAASTFYKRAADAYQQLGDMPREERLYRLESARCNAQIQAWASVASDYTRAADLLLQQCVEDGQSDPTIANPGLEASSYHQQAAAAWTQLGEKSKAAGSQIKAAVALNSSSTSNRISKQALTVMEEAIEAHVPDLFNPFARYRQTGVSAFINPDNPDETILKPSPETLELAREHVVTAAYAHEPLQELVYTLAGQYREYPTALYAAGAASYLLEQSGSATLSCSRAYLTETILLLALGDAVAAQQVFLNRHVQRDFYLTARECKLAEELFRAVLNRDPDALDEARSPSGENKAALQNLHSSLKQLVMELRLSGVAKSGGDGGGTKSKPSSKPKSKKSTPTEHEGEAADASLQDLVNMKTGYEKDAAQGANLNSDALAAELDGLDFGGLDDDDDDDVGLGGGCGDGDDDDFDLR